MPYEWGLRKNATFFNESKVQGKVNVRNNRNVMHFIHMHARTRTRAPTATQTEIIP